MALKVLDVTSAPVRSRVMFSSMWGFIVFSVLHLWRSRALFSSNPWPPVVFLEVVFFRFGALVLYFPVCGALPFSVFDVALGCLLERRVRSGARSA